MKKVFGEYAGVIVTVVAVCSLIGFVGLAMQPGGVMDGAFGFIVGMFVDKTDVLLNAGDSGGLPEFVLPEDTDTVVFRVENIPEGVNIYNITFGLDDIADLGYTNESQELIVPAAYKSKNSNNWYKITSVDVRGFRDCMQLETIVLPDTVTSILAQAFMGCSNLKRVYLGQNSQLKEIEDNAFSNCESLELFYFPASVQKIGYASFSNCSSLGTVSFAKNSQLTAIDGYVFAECGLKSAHIPASVQSIGSQAFARCPDLNSVHFEDPSGWDVRTSSNSTSPWQVIDSSILADDAQAADYLVNKHWSRYWFKTEALFC